MAALAAVTVCAFGVFAVEISDAFFEDSSSYKLKPISGLEVYAAKLPLEFPYDPKAFKDELWNLAKRRDVIGKKLSALNDTNFSPEAAVAKKYIPEYTQDKEFIARIKNLQTKSPAQIGNYAVSLMNTYTSEGVFGKITNRIINNHDDLSVADKWTEFGITELSEAGIGDWCTRVSNEYQRVLNSLSDEFVNYYNGKLALIQDVAVATSDMEAVQKYLLENKAAFEAVMVAVGDYYTNISYCEAYIGSFFAAYFAYRDGTPVNAKSPDSFYVASKSN